MAENCSVCGQLMQQVGEGIYACIHCGILAESRELRRVESPPPKCEYCEDRGYVQYTKQVNGILCHYGARCFCSAGERYPLFPAIAQVFPAALMERKTKVEG